ncbi:MAG: SusC/RagA family TonB-linked outer membrane protein [Lentimicrobium sp.]|jgi:iron complex outermembrane receptor protein|nr:SusC/RagA family TonB-linked outer membrane protein [Lentimicrobium sp.]
MKKIITFLLMSLFITLNIYAQQRQISGTVRSSDDGETLPGVSILIKGSSQGTATDVDGTYKLNIPSGPVVLVFSFVGYTPAEVEVGNRDVVDMELTPEARRLDEVVVTALGVKREKREIGYSSEKINTDEILRTGAPNVIGALSGRSAGVQISQGDGVDGGSTRITIRGNNNLARTNQPLIVVDNVPMENISGLDNIGRGVDWGNGIADLNPFDIEDYTVLKGGAASALYGERGANGVILITTKRGKKQAGLGVTYNYNIKLSHPYRYREVQNKYGHGGPVSLSKPTFPIDEDGTLLYPGIYGNDQLILDAQGNTSTTAQQFGYYGSAVSWGPQMNGERIKWWDGEMRDYSPQPDNLKIPFKDGITQTHNVSVQGGNDKGTIRLSLTNQDHTPIINNSNYNRTTVNFGTNIKISEKLKADAAITYVKYKRLNSPMIGEDGNSFSKGLLYSWPRSYQGIDRENYQMADGSRNLLDGYPFQYVDRYLWWNYFNNNTWQDRDKYTASIALIYDIAPWLNATGRIGRDYTIEQFTSKNKPVDFIGQLEGGYSNSLEKNTNDNMEVLITAHQKKIFNSSLSLRFTVGASRWDYDTYGIAGASGTWYYPNMYTFFNFTDYIFETDEEGNTIVVNPGSGNSGSSLIPNESIRKVRTNSAFSFLNLTYKDYLFLEVTGRNDWSSTLPRNSNSYFYPSASLSFIASEAFKIQQKLPWFNFLKIRGGIAQTANSPSAYEKNFYYNSALFGGQQASFLPEVIPPFELMPQFVTGYEAGLNMGFFDNRIDLDFTWYYKKSTDQILQLPVPVSSGAYNITINRGELSNQGVEFILNTVPVQTRNIIVKAGMNFAHNRNHIISLGGYSDSYHLADIWGLNGPAMDLYEGDEYGTITGYDYVYDAQGNRILNDEGTHYKITDTRVPIGNASPDFIAGFTTEILYKNFRLAALIDTKWGGDIYSGSYVISLQTGQSPETLLERDGGGLPYTDPGGITRNVGVILEGVYQDGTPNDKVVHYYYKYMPNAGGWGKFVSTPGILENTWVKMREISLSYGLPQSVLKKVKVFQSLTLSVVGRDLFYIYTTLPDKINPEGIMGSGNAQGFEWASFPGVRSVTFGASATF